MLRPEQVERPEHQEARGRRALNNTALIKSAFLAAALVFVFPAAAPWFSHEAFITVFGRVLAHNVIVEIVAHCLVSLFYGWVIALCIYRLPTGGGILVGTALFLPLYGLNYLIFKVAGGYPGNEFHVGLAHLYFCLVFSCAYKAMAVPRARVDGRKRNGRDGALRGPQTSTTN